jgi:hypothetical protein
MRRLDRVETMEYRLDDAGWAQVVLWFIALNVLDLGLTLHLIGQGAVEMNPVMATMLDAGWEWAAVYKASLTGLVALGLWFGRAHRLVRRAGIAFVVLFVAIIAYEILDVVVAA